MRPSVRDQVANGGTSTAIFRAFTDVQKNSQWLQKFKEMKQKLKVKECLQGRLCMVAKVFSQDASTE